MIRTIASYGWTIGLAAFVLVLHAALDGCVAFQLDRAKLVAEPWRAITGHFTHWSFDHLFWDLSMFTVTAAVIEARSRARLLVTVFASALAISGAILLLEPAIGVYRGLSGIDSALFVVALVALLREAHAEGRGWTQGLLVAALTGFVAKLVYECVTGTVLFVPAADFTPLALSHVVGGAVGAVVGATWCCRNARERMPLPPTARAELS